MKFLSIFFGLFLVGCFSQEAKTSREPNSEKKPTATVKQFQWCMCNFNGCLGERNLKCTKVIRCKKTTAADYAQTIGNHKALLVLDDHRFCANPMEGVMQGGM